LLVVELRAKIDRRNAVRRSRGIDHEIHEGGGDSRVPPWGEA
jgi:hypothetical protein